MSYDQQLSVIAARAIPFIIPPSGSVGNNGALTLGTSLPATYANSYMYFAAGQVYAGSPAGWYFTQMTSATQGVVYSNLYTAPGVPNIPATPAIAPLVITGPGSFTGIGAIQNMVQVSVPPNAMGPNSTLRYTLSYSVPNNGNNKTFLASFGGTTVFNASVTTVVSANVQRSLANRALTNSQVNDGGVGLFSGGTGGGNAVYSALDTTQAQTFVVQGLASTATDYVVLEKFLLEVLYGG